MKTAARFDYSRRGVGVSLVKLFPLVLIGLISAAGLRAQYPGRIAKTDKAQPILRSVAVLEWTGDAGKPSASRLVPVTVYDGEQLNDGTIYLSRPEPLALASGVEYELQRDGKAMGLFDVFQAGELDGAWQGFGAWKPLSKAAAENSKNAFNTSSMKNGGKVDVDVADSDKPVLKRKHPKGTDTDSDSGSSSGSTDSKKTSDSSAKSDAAADPDRPTLHRKTGADSGSGTASSDSSDSGKGTAAVDPDRPTLHRSHKNDDGDSAERSNVAPDPDRPRLKRGKPADYLATETPKLTGTPPSMQQAVAVSDVRSAAEHPFKYSWANPEDENRMKVALEAIARKELGLDAPAVAPAKTVKKTAVATTPAAKRKANSLLHPAAPVELANEQFRVFELTYGATATMVLTASTADPNALVAPVVKDEAKVEKPTDKPADDPDRPVIKYGKQTPKAEAEAAAPLVVAPAGSKTAAPQKFVTLVAQPDLYGGILVLYKSVTDSAHLYKTPRMRLVDAVDVMGDNRGELLFELRGDQQRQFAMYRVLRGSAEQLFATIAIP